MIPRDIVDLVQKIEAAKFPENVIAQGVVSSTERRIKVDEGLGTIVILTHSVTQYADSHSRYDTLSYYLSEYDGLQMLEQLKQDGVACIEADACCIRESGDRVLPSGGEGKARIQYGHISGRVGLNLATYHLTLDELKFTSLGEAIELKSNNGPVKSEEIRGQLQG